MSLQGKKILITGITGFVGKHLANELKKSGANVYGLSRKNSDKKTLKATVIDYSLIDEFVKKEKIQICFHLAAEALVESGQADPYQTFKINTTGTLNILEIARKNNLEKVIVASTSHVYGENPVPFLEEYPPKPSRPYETSKTCTDLIAQSYADTFGLPVLIPRFVNIYGPGDTNFTRLIPKTIRNVLQNKPPTMWGGSAVRDYLYIDDAIEAYMRLVLVDMESVGKNRIFNFGTKNIISVKELIEKIIRISGTSLQIEKIADERESEISAQYVSWEKAKKILTWAPKVSLGEGLRNAFDWYKNYLQSSV